MATLQGGICAVRSRVAEWRARMTRPDARETITDILPWGLAHGGGRPSYLYGVLNAARMARQLNIEEISVIEFGIAGGNGMVALESASEMASELFGTRINVYGFDAGTEGMPEPCDVRDAPWEFVPGDFKMDLEALETRLRAANLVLGDVRETVTEWVSAPRDPVGFVAFDLNQFTGTRAAMAVLETNSESVLPMVTCFFGCVTTDYVGEGAAIVEFNERNVERKIGRNDGLRYRLPRNQQHLPWPSKIYTAHIFDHPMYGQHLTRGGGKHPSEAKMHLRP